MAQVSEGMARVNGGPEMPLADAVKVLKSKLGRKPAGGAQRDIEDADQAGPHPDQVRREADVGGINTLRQRLSQRRLAAERGAPFRRAKARAGSFPTA